MSSPFVWFDLRTKNRAQAKKFYQGLLGWEAKDAPMGDGSVTMIGSGDNPWGMIADDGAESRWLPYIQVENADTATKKARQLGASVQQDVTDGPAGRFSIIADPTGAHVALWQRRA